MRVEFKNTTKDELEILEAYFSNLSIDLIEYISKKHSISYESEVILEAIEDIVFFINGGFRIFDMNNERGESLVEWIKEQDIEDVQIIIEKINNREIYINQSIDKVKTSISNLYCDLNESEKYPHYNGNIKLGIFFSGEIQKDKSKCKAILEEINTDMLKFMDKYLHKYHLAISRSVDIKEIYEKDILEQF